MLHKRKELVSNKKRDTRLLIQEINKPFPDEMKISMLETSIDCWNIGLSSYGG